MQTRTILRKLLYRFVEGFTLIIICFTLFDLLWYGCDVVKALAEGGDWHIVQFKLTLNLNRLVALPALYSCGLVILDSLGMETKGPLLKWIEERYHRKLSGGSKPGRG